MKLCWFIFVCCVMVLMLMFSVGVLSRCWYRWVRCVLCGSGVFSGRVGIVVSLFSSSVIICLLWLFSVYLVGRFIVLCSSVCSNGDILIIW